MIVKTTKHRDFRLPGLAAIALACAATACSAGREQCFDDSGQPIFLSDGNTLACPTLTSAAAASEEPGTIIAVGADDATLPPPTAPAPTSPPACDSSQQPGDSCGVDLTCAPDLLCTCGDGTVDAGEACDDGPGGSSTCSTACEVQSPPPPPSDPCATLPACTAPAAPVDQVIRLSNPQVDCARGVTSSNLDTLRFVTLEPGTYVFAPVDYDGAAGELDGGVDALPPNGMPSSRWTWRAYVSAHDPATGAALQAPLRLGAPSTYSSQACAFAHACDARVELTLTQTADVYFYFQDVYCADNVGALAVSVGKR
ncbi:MAG: hypothetical protein ACPGUV_00245 [Polyangiales bacterium]